MNLALFHLHKFLTFDVQDDSLGIVFSLKNFSLTRLLFRKLLILVIRGDKPIFSWLNINEIWFNIHIKTRKRSNENVEK